MTTSFRQFNAEQKLVENLVCNGLVEELQEQATKPENWSAEMTADELFEALGIDNNV